MREEWLLLVWQHKGKILGTLLGFGLGWLLINYGFLKTLVLVTVTAAGLFVGWLLDGGDSRPGLSGLRRWFER